MSYRDHDYMSPTGTHPVGSHANTEGSGWGAIIVVVFLVGILGLAMIFGPEGEQTGAGNNVPAVEQTAPTADPGAGGEIAPAQPQPTD